MTWYDRLIAAHLAVTTEVSHGMRIKSDRYFVWQEDGVNDLRAGGGHAERAVTGTTDFFTKVEFDPWCEEFERSLTRHRIAWAKESVQFEEKTGFFHHEWTWEVA